MAGEISNLRKDTVCCEFRSLLSPVSGDTHLNQQLKSGVCSQGGTVPYWEILPHPWPQHFTAPEATLSLPTWKTDIIFHLVVFPLAQGWLSQFFSAFFSSVTVPGPVPRGSRRFHAAVVGHRLSHQLNSCLQGNGSFLWLLNGYKTHPSLGRV